jgi:hypothetical protein
MCISLAPILAAASAGVSSDRAGVAGALLEGLAITLLQIFGVMERP